jgi:hypothetical protein
MVDFYEIYYACDAIEDDLEATTINLVASGSPKWWTFELLR